ncbi:MAG: AhpC/TSA family protein [Ardenticatenales bacterium]|nr:AhpC/TSA family protein [Ardenticatenales bacterium]
MVQVVPHAAALKERRINVVAVSFGNPYWARAWLNETGAPFPVWLDPERQSYELLGLGRSFWHSWGPRQLWYYARAVLKGAEMHEYRGDTLQLGGDMIVDRTGRIRYLYRSQASTDRPPVAELLKILHKLD